MNKIVFRGTWAECAHYAETLRKKSDIYVACAPMDTNDPWGPWEVLAVSKRGRAA